MQDKEGIEGSIGQKVLQGLSLLTFIREIL